MTEVRNQQSSPVGPTIYYFESAESLSYFESETFRVQPLFARVTRREALPFTVTAIHKLTGEQVTLAHFGYIEPARTFADMARIVSKSFD